MKSIIFLLSILSFFLLSCGEEPEGGNNACAITNPLGDCPDGERCYKGGCIPLDAECETHQIMAPCQDVDQICENNGGVFECVDPPCSSRNLDGFCPEGQICTYPGYCQDECSPENPEGGCADENTICTAGECINKNMACSSDNPTGECPDNWVCSSGTCIQGCSEEFPEGACEDSEKSCLEGVCISNPCSSDNPSGNCPNNKICQEGICLFQCSPDHIDGLCPEEQACDNGSCKFLCSANYPEGYCINSETRCIQGSCVSRCSQTVPNGFCDDTNQTCIEGICRFECSIAHTDGFCSNDDQNCFQGECQYPCSDEHREGYCVSGEQVCYEGACVGLCSPTNLTGPCLEEDHFCNDQGECEEYPCSETNPDGPCPDSQQICYNNVCSFACSPSHPEGYCTAPGYVCHPDEGICVDPIQQPCSTYFPEGYCNEHYSCKAGTCVEDDCSPTYPTGLCPGNQVCMNGVCEEPQLCSDGRPLDGTEAACCETSADCDPGNYLGEAFTFCFGDDGHDSGNYCSGFFQGCSSDGACNDHTSSNDPKEFICNRFTTEGGTDVTTCERVPLDCNARSVPPGGVCNEDCKDSECFLGSLCINGICSPSCAVSDGVNDNPDCNYNGRQYPCWENTFDINHNPEESFRGFSFCLDVCYGDNYCTTEGTICNDMVTYYHDGDNPSPFDSLLDPIWICGPPKDGEERGEYCSQTTETANGFGDDLCSTGICNANDNKCSSPCDDDTACPENSFCSFEHQLLYEYSGTRYILNHIGVCRDLEDISDTTPTCSHCSDCPGGCEGEYQCIPKLLDDGSVQGVCGRLDRSSRAYHSEGGSCNRLTWYCDTDLCIKEDGNGIALTDDIEDGTCREYCETSEVCPKNVGDQNTNYICKSVQMRPKLSVDDEVTQEEAYGGVCIPQSGSITPCSNTIVACSDPTEVCVPNLPSISRGDVEYLCVEQNSAGLALGDACEVDLDCQSRVCHPNLHTCTSACTNNSQCLGFDNATCSDQVYIIYPNENPANQIYASICE